MVWNRYRIISEKRTAHASAFTSSWHSLLRFYDQPDLFQTIFYLQSVVVSLSTLQLGVTSCEKPLITFGFIFLPKRNTG
jgi:hypothetical protein